MSDPRAHRGTHQDLPEMVKRIDAAIAQHLEELMDLSAEELIEQKME